jgi:tetratricopeptide (TPR) repeat protein
MYEGNIDGAITDLKRALGLDPENDTARYNLAGLLVGQGRYEEAIAEYEKIDDRDTITWIDITFNEIRVLLNAGKRDACSVLISKWLIRIEQLLKDCPADEEGFLVLNKTERLNLDYLARRYLQILDFRVSVP